MRVRKAIIPAAGLGTRFLPASKAQPKEMLHIVDKPAIQYIVEEAAASGIEDIIIVTGRGKRAIEDHFDKSFELEQTLRMKKKWDLLAQVQEVSNLADIHYIRQKEPLGLGHAIWCARKFIGDEPFAVLLGDDIVQSDPPCLKQLMDVFDRYNSSIVGVQTVQDEEVSKYGIIDPKGNELEPGVLPIAHLVEKPSLEEAPSGYAIMGRYILRPEVMHILSDLPSGAAGEIQLTDALNKLNQRQAVLSYQFSGLRHDVGDKFGAIKATIDLALQRDDLKDKVEAYMKHVVRDL